MLKFVLSVLSAIVWTFVAVRTSYEEVKRISQICAFLWWLIVIIRVFNFVI